jgi:adenine-specific DNA-methyltransferase
VPHITLKSIAQNTRLDPIFAKYQPEIDRLEKQLAKTKGGEKTQLELRAIKRRKQSEVDRIITENGEQETLYDQPYEDRGKVRVSGPFTVESIPQPSVTDASESPVAQWQPIEADARGDDLAKRGRGAVMTGSGTDFILNLIELLRKDGLTRMGGGVLKFAQLNPIPSGGVLHAEGELETKNGKGKTVAVSFGPQYGPVTVKQVEGAVQTARGRYDGVAFVGFTFDAPAQEFMKKELPLTVMGAYIAPDVLVGDLLKAPKGSQLFTMFGSADIAVKETKEGCVVKVNGVDLYDPNTGQVVSDQGDQIAAWFLDTDYDQRTFNICQAFFPGGGQNPWEKLARALRGSIKEDAFEALRGLESLPFQLGSERRIAVKVIDHRGNEMVEVREFKGAEKPSRKAAVTSR